MPPATTTTTRKRAPARAKTPLPEAEAPTLTPPEVEVETPAEELGLVIPTGKDASDPPADRVMIPVFTYRGKTFSMPAEISLQTVFFGIRVATTKGNLPGGLLMIERLLGPDAIDILLNAPEIGDEHLLAIIDTVLKHLFGLAERAEEAQGE